MAIYNMRPKEYNQIKTGRRIKEELMSKDLIKTIGAVVLIGIIVVATFLYGNQQRQTQLRRDQQAKQEHERKAEESTNQSATQGTTGTAPVQTPSQSTNSGLQSPQPAPTGSTTVTANVGGGTLPKTTPNTGGEASAPIGLVVLSGLSVAYVRSRKLAPKVIHVQY
jgi:hypothetical protein